MVAEEQVASAQDELETAKALAEKDPSDMNKPKLSEANRLAEAEESSHLCILQLFQQLHPANLYLPDPQRPRHDHPQRTDRSHRCRTVSHAAAYELAQANLEDAQNYLNILTGVETMDEVPASSVTSITGAKLALNAAQSDLRCDRVGRAN